MRATVLEPAVSAGVDPVKHAHEICRVREAVQSGARSAVFSPATRAVIRQVIRQGWDTMLRQGVDPRGVTPQFLDSRELESLRDDPNLALTWRMLIHHLGWVRHSEFMAAVSDARGCVVWTGGNTEIRDEVDPHTRPRRLVAVINLTGAWAKVHSDTLGGFMRSHSASRMHCAPPNTARSGGGWLRRRDCWSGSTAQHW